MDHKEKDSQSGRNSYRNTKDKRNISEGTNALLWAAKGFLLNDLSILSNCTAK